VAFGRVISLTEAWLSVASRTLVSGFEDISHIEGVHRSRAFPCYPLDKQGKGDFVQIWPPDFKRLPVVRCRPMSNFGERLIDDMSASRDLHPSGSKKIKVLTPILEQKLVRLARVSDDQHVVQRNHRAELGASLVCELGRRITPNMQKPVDRIGDRSGQAIERPSFPRDNRDNGRMRLDKLLNPTECVTNRTDDFDAAFIA